MSSALPGPLARRRKTFLTLAISSVLLIPAGFLANEYFDAVASDDALSSVAMVLILLAPFLGIAAVRMARRDMESIQNGIIPSSAMTATKWGRNLGAFGSVANTILLLLFLLQASSFSGADLAKNALLRDLNGLMSHAYQYRNRPSARGGGHGTYIGYHVPNLLKENVDGFYSASVIHADTLLLTAAWRKDSGSTVSVRLGPNGRPVGSWTFVGGFKE